MVRGLKRILLAEDDRLLNHTISFHLTKRGYELIYPHNIGSAKEHILRKGRVENEYTGRNGFKKILW